MRKILNILNELILRPVIETAFILFLFSVCLYGVSEGSNWAWIGIIIIGISVALQSAICSGYMLEEKYPEIFKGDKK